MGVRQSKQDAFTNDLHPADPGEPREGAACLGCLFPPAPPTRHGGRVRSRSNSGAALRDGAADYDDDDGSLGFGTPVPDTPEPVRRIRDAAMEKFYNEEGGYGGEEKKSGGGSFGGRVRRRHGSGADAETRSSRYGGLEKETSAMFAGEMAESSGARPPRAAQDVLVAGGRGGGGRRQQPFAGLHDGPDAESRLYQKYELCEVLGVGSTSTCHRCVELSTMTSRACKIIDKNEIEPKFREMMDQFYVEVKTLRSLQHPNIIRLYDVYVSDDKIYIVMELMNGGELFDYVVQKGTLTEEEASRIVRRVTGALVYMHSKNVVHRDLKPENLLLTHKPRSSHDVEVKIIDFGLSKIMSDGPSTGSFLGTRGYLAPEMIQRREYTKSVDAWALGVIIFVLLCGCLPFDDDCQSIPNSPDLRSKFALRFPRWAKDLSPSARDLLARLLDINPCTRYTAEMAMDHPWVRGETASRESLLQSPGRIKPSPAGGGKGGAGRGRGTTSQATREQISQMVANRAKHNAQIAARSPRVHVRKTSI